MNVGLPEALGASYVRTKTRRASSLQQEEAAVVKRGGIPIKRHICTIDHTRTFRKHTVTAKHCCYARLSGRVKSCSVAGCYALITQTLLQELHTRAAGGREGRREGGRGVARGESHQRVLVFFESVQVNHLSHIMNTKFTFTCGYTHMHMACCFLCAVC